LEKAIDELDAVMEALGPNSLIGADGTSAHL
jgi:hypothetical protein